MNFSPSGLKPLIFAGSILLSSLIVTDSFADDGRQQRVEQLRKQLLGGTKTRGFKKPSTDVTSLPRVFYAEVSGINPKTLTNLADSDHMSLSYVDAPETNPLASSKGELGLVKGAEAIRLDYSVDPSSQLTGEVFFSQGSARITSNESRRYLSELAEALQGDEMKNYAFVIEGHASAEGNAIANKRLSVKRAQSIYDVLVHEHGVRSYQVFALGFGEDEARHSADSSESVLAMDRRVLVYRLTSSSAPKSEETEPEQVPTKYPKKTQKRETSGISL